MRRKPRWYKVAQERATAMATKGFPTKQTENGQWWVLASGSELWATVNAAINEENSK